jgi:hypothetical protein
MEFRSFTRGRAVAQTGLSLLALTAAGALLALWLAVGLLAWLVPAAAFLALDLWARRRHAGDAAVLAHLGYQRQTLLFAGLAFLLASVALWPLVLLLFLDLPLMLACTAISLWVLWRSARGWRALQTAADQGLR